jgi:hypothetical protein
VDAILPEGRFIVQIALAPNRLARASAFQISQVSGSVIGQAGSRLWDDRQRPAAHRRGSMWTASEAARSAR